MNLINNNLCSFRHNLANFLYSLFIASPHDYLLE